MSIDHASADLQTRGVLGQVNGLHDDEREPEDVAESRPRDC